MAHIAGLDEASARALKRRWESALAASFRLAQRAPPLRVAAAAWPLPRSLAAYAAAEGDLVATRSALAAVGIAKAPPMAISSREVVSLEKRYPGCAVSATGRDAVLARVRAAKTTRGRQTRTLVVDTSAERRGAQLAELIGLPEAVYAAAAREDAGAEEREGAGALTVARAAELGQRLLLGGVACGALAPADAMRAVRFVAAPTHECVLWWAPGARGAAAVGIDVRYIDRIVRAAALSSAGLLSAAYDATRDATRGGQRVVLGLRRDMDETLARSVAESWRAGWASAAEARSLEPPPTEAPRPKATRYGAPVAYEAAASATARPRAATWLPGLHDLGAAVRTAALAFQKKGGVIAETKSGRKVQGKNSLVAERWSTLAPDALARDGSGRAYVRRSPGAAGGGIHSPNVGDSSPARQRRLVRRGSRSSLATKLF